MKKIPAHFWFVALYVSALLAIVAGIQTAGWNTTWSAWQVPPQQPSFIDMRTVQAGVQAVQQGLNPQQVNPDDRYGRVMDYPDVWLSIGRLFHFEQESAYLAFCVALVGMYVIAGVFCLYRWPSIWILLALLSPASLLAMERGNNDMLVYVLVWLFCLAGSRLLALLPGLCAVLLKVYPVAIIGSLLIRRDKRLLIGFIPLLALVFAYLYSQLEHIRAGVTKGVKLSYGLPHWSHVFDKAGLATWLFGIFVFVVLLGVAAMFRFLLRLPLQRDMPDTLEYRAFLAGAGIYVFTWLFASNWDYRLIFLNLCLPFLLQSGMPWRSVPMVLMLVSMFFMPMLALAGHVGILLNILAKLAVFVFLAASLLVLLYRSWQPLMVKNDVQ